MSNFEIESLEKLLRDFYNLTGIKTCLYDRDGTELCFYPSKFSHFCEVLRQDNIMDSRCRDCDRLAFANCRKTRSQYAYTCHVGLQECVSPILYDNQIIGFIMIGQIKQSDKHDFIYIEKNIPQNLKSQLKTAYEHLPVISAEKLLSAFHILDACASYELLKTLIQFYNNPIDAQIDKYIRDNLSKPLSVSHICSIFHLSHGEIYNICKEYFNCTPGEYIKKIRLAHACKLLATTSLSVKSIAIQCGIPDYNYFSKVFKSAFGSSPTQYKKLHIR